ncbi:hypothetical protein D9M71_577930 [compost metagenome]
MAEDFQSEYPWLPAPGAWFPIAAIALRSAHLLSASARSGIGWLAPQQVEIHGEDQPGKESAQYVVKSVHPPQ